MDLRRLSTRCLPTRPSCVPTSPNAPYRASLRARSRRPAARSVTSTGLTGCPTRPPTPPCVRSAAACAAPSAPPRRLARPFDIPDLRQLVASIDRTTSKGARDVAIILLGLAGALRISEIAKHDYRDLEFKSTGAVLHLRRSKTDPEAGGQIVGIAPGHHATTAARAGVSVDRIAAQTRHKKVSILLERYIRPAEILETTSSRDLGP